MLFQALVAVAVSCAGAGAGRETRGGEKVTNSLRVTGGELEGSWRLARQEGKDKEGVAGVSIKIYIS